MAETLDDGVKTRVGLLRQLFESYALSWDQMKQISGLKDSELKDLIEEGYILARPSFFTDKMHYLPTSKAKDYLLKYGVKIYVEVPKEAPMKNEMHDAVLTNLRLWFRDMGYAVWQSERCLKQRGMNEVTPDGILELGRRKVAIELELSAKTPKQYEKRFMFYQNHPAIDAVLYFVATPKQREKLLELSRNYSKIYVTLLRNFMDHRANAYVERSGFPGALYLCRFLEAIIERRFLSIDTFKKQAA